MKDVCIKSTIILLFSTLCLSNITLAQKQDTKVSRKDELILEAIINDFILRNQIKREFPFPYKFEAYSSVLADSIVVYVHCWIPQDQLIQGNYDDIRSNAEKHSPELQKYMLKWINGTVLDFDDFKWAISYKLSIVLRVGLEPILWFPPPFQKKEKEVPTYTEDAETIFVGFPKKKVSEGGLDRVVEDLPRKKAANLQCVISKIEDKYYWASRENVEMVKIERAGAFITFLAVNGSGYVKVIKPELKEAASLMSKTEESFDYVEHLTIGLRSVNYWGEKES
jgi:hypothetical protein